MKWRNTNLNLPFLLFLRIISIICSLHRQFRLFYFLPARPISFCLIFTYSILFFIFLFHFPFIFSFPTHLPLLFPCLICFPSNPCHNYLPNLNPISVAPYIKKGKRVTRRSIACAIYHFIACWLIIKPINVSERKWNWG